MANNVNNKIAFLSKKGGVGKTFWTLNSSAAYAKLIQKLSQEKKAVYIDMNFENSDGFLRTGKDCKTLKPYLKMFPKGKFTDLKKAFTQSEHFGPGLNYMFPGNNHFDLIYDQKERLGIKTETLLNLNKAIDEQLTDYTIFLDLNHISVNDAYRKIWESSAIKTVVASFYDDSVYGDIIDFFSLIYHYERRDQVTDAMKYAQTIAKNQSLLKKISDETKIKEQEIKRIFEPFKNITKYIKNMNGKQPDQYLKEFYKNHIKAGELDKIIQYSKTLSPENPLIYLKEKKTQAISLGQGKTVIVVNDDPHPDDNEVKEFIQTIKENSRIELDQLKKGEDNLFIMPYVGNLHEKSGNGEIFFTQKPSLIKELTQDLGEKVGQLYRVNKFESPLKPFEQFSEYIHKTLSGGLP